MEGNTSATWTAGMSIKLTGYGENLFSTPHTHFTMSDFEIWRDGMKRYKFYHPISTTHPIAIFDGDERSSEALKAMKMLLITRRLTK